MIPASSKENCENVGHMTIPLQASEVPIDQEKFAANEKGCWSIRDGSYARIELNFAVEMHFLTMGSIERSADRILLCYLALPAQDIVTIAPGVAIAPE